MQLASDSFGDNEPMPHSSGYKNGNERPRLEISGVPPPSTSSLALLMYDPDAPGGSFTHWLAWNIPPLTTEIVPDELPSGALQGTNDMNEVGYAGPAPPSGTHHYHFVLYALDTSPTIPNGTKRAAFDQAISGHVIGKTELVGLYSA